MIELIRTEEGSKVTAIMRATMHNHPPVTTTVTGTEDLVRQRMRREYTQHLLGMMQEYTTACMGATGEKARNNRTLLIDFIRMNQERDHMQLAQQMCELFERQFLEAMLPPVPGYSNAYCLMIELQNTAKHMLTNLESHWVLGPWQQLATEGREAYTVAPWKDVQLKKVA